MTRELSHYFENSVSEVFNAYYSAASQSFGKACTAEPFRSLSFRLKASLRYNMNGGSCVVTFMPCGNGTAVNVRYVIAQLAAARYNAFDRDMTDYVCSLLGAPADALSPDPGAYLPPEQSFRPDSALQAAAVPQQPVLPEAPVQQASEPPRFCTQCGARLSPGAVFCSQCGKKLL